MVAILLFNFLLSDSAEKNFEIFWQIKLISNNITSVYRSSQHTTPMSSFALWYANIYSYNLLPISLLLIAFNITRITSPRRETSKRVEERLSLESLGAAEVNLGSCQIHYSLFKFLNCTAFLELGRKLNISFLPSF